MMQDLSDLRHCCILQPDYNRHMNVARQPLRSISLVVYKGVQMLDVAGPRYMRTPA
jgi:hypothetical protein